MQLVLGLPSPWELNLPDGLTIRPYSFQEAPRHARTIRVALGPTAGFRRALDGYYVRVATLGEIFAQFETTGIHDIVINWPDQNRELFWMQQVRSQLSTEGALQRLIMPEDGHNEKVVWHVTEGCGFKADVRGDWLEVHR